MAEPKPGPQDLPLSRLLPSPCDNRAVAATETRVSATRRRLVWGGGLWLALALLFVVLAVLAAFYDRFPADEGIARAIQDIDVPAFGGFLAFVNFLGDAWIATALVLALTVAFGLVRAGSEAVLVFLAFVPQGVNVVLKGLVERPRPSPELVEVTSHASGFSFASGHTAITAGLFGLLFFLLPAVIPWRPLRWTLQAGCVLIVLAAGPARVYVGVHWPSDVLGGYLLAFLLLAPLLLAYHALRANSNSR